MMYPWLQSTVLPKTPQAVCIAGVSGLGQTELAEHFARALLSAKDLTIHPDILRLTPEPGKSIGIDTVRDIHEFCLLSSTRASRKVILIDDADAMTQAAQQAFLKTLEEPVVPVTFIVLTTRLNQLLPTLRSRCQIINIPSVSYQLAKPWFDQQKLMISSEDYALTDGAPLMVLQPAFQDRQAAYRLLTDVLQRKTPDVNIIKQLVKSEPLHVLAGFYYALMHQKQFKLLDACIALRQKYSQNPNLNWDMQLNGFLIESTIHAH